MKHVMVTARRGGIFVRSTLVKLLRDASPKVEEREEIAEMLLEAANYLRYSGKYTRKWKKTCFYTGVAVEGDISALVRQGFSHAVTPDADCVTLTADRILSFHGIHVMVMRS